MSMLDGSYLSFARRTKTNLDYIQQAKENPELQVFEVTQLVNSLLGLLLFPRAFTWGYFESYELDQLNSQDWPDLTNQSIAHDKLLVNNLEEVLHQMRNAVAHNDLKFISDQNDEIECIVFRNTNSKRPNRPYMEWVLKLNLKDLRLFLDRLLVEYERIA